MSSFVANMQQNDGEDEGSNDRPTLKEYLSSLPNVYLKLEKEGITELDIFVYINEKDLEILCGSNGINLSFMEAIKFKSSVRKLQTKFAPKKEKQIVSITMDEEQELNKINFASKQALDVHTLFENHFNQIEDHVFKMKCCVDDEIKNITNNITKILKQRKKSLYKKIEEWKIMKLENINEEISKIVKYENQLKSVKNECNQLLTNNDDDNIKNRYNKIKKIIQEIFENNKSFELFEEYIVKHTKMINIKFEENILISQLERYGKIENNIDNQMVNIPKIELKKPIKTNKDKNGYKVKLKWKLTTIDPKNKRDFIIKFKKNNDNDDDEKKIINDDDEWMIANHQKIKLNKNNIFEADIDNIFECNTNYHCNIKLTISEPITLSIKSNIVKLVINHNIHQPPKGNVVKISLEEHSQRKFRSNCNPRYLLNKDRNVYASAYNSDFSENENDWIIFKIQENHLYFPTKFTIKNYFGDGQDVKTMRLWIGDGNSNWNRFNPNIINVAKNENYQSFDIDGVDDKIIKQNGFNHIKLEFITNHGESRSTKCKFVVKEFHLYGIQF